MEGAGAPQHLIKFYGHSSGVLGWKSGKEYFPIDNSILSVYLRYYIYTY